MRYNQTAAFLDCSSDEPGRRACLWEHRPMASSASWSPSDPLGDALHLLRMRGTFYCRSELREPWALEVPAFADTLSFHVLTAGSAVLQVPGEEPIDLGPGDLAVVPHACGHTIASSAGAGPAGRVDLLPQRYLSEHYSVLTHGGEGDRKSTRLNSSHVAISYASFCWKKKR